MPKILLDGYFTTFYLPIDISENIRTYLHNAKSCLVKGYFYDCQRNDYFIQGLKMTKHHNNEIFCWAYYMLSYLAKTEQKAVVKNSLENYLNLIKS